MGLVLFVLVSSAWAGTLKDNFDDGNANEWQMFVGKANNSPIDQSTQWVVEKGELVSISKDVCTWSSIFGIGENTWTDYEFEFRFRIENIFSAGCGNVSPLIGFGVHFDNPDEFTINGLDVVVLENGGVFNRPICERFFRGGYTDLGNAGNISIKQSEWYTAKIVANGNWYKMSINNQLLCDIKHDLPDAGSAVIMGKNCEVHFDDIIITGNGIPDKNLGLFIDPKAKLATTWAKIKQEK